MGRCTRTLRREFHWKKLGFGGVKAERFCTSHWRMPIALNFVYRIAIMIYVNYWLAYSLKNRRRNVNSEAGELKWGDFLTNWTYTLLAIYVSWHLVATIIFHAQAWRNSHPSLAGLLRVGRPSVALHRAMFLETDSVRESMDQYEQIATDTESGGDEYGEGQTADLPRPPWYLCLVWVLYTTVSTAACMVTIVYFTLLYHGVMTLNSMQAHLINAFVVLVEHLISAVPFRLLHVVYPFLYGLTYALYSLFYWVEDHRHVMYGFLNWNRPSAALTFLSVVFLVLLPVVHGFFFLLHKAKYALYQRL